MTYRHILLRSIALLTCLGLPLVSKASGIIPAPTGSSTEFHVEIGLTYASGVENVIDQMETNFGFDRDSSWPVGLKLTAYARRSDGFGFGVGVGPSEFFQVKDHNHHYNHNDDTTSSYIIPMFADIRYYLSTNSSFTPYVRAGVSCPLAGGDYIGSGSPGAVVAIGAHVWEHRIVAVGVELGYDDSRVKVKDGYLHQAEKVRPTEFTFSVFATF